MSQVNESPTFLATTVENGYVDRLRSIAEEDVPIGVNEECAFVLSEIVFEDVDSGFPSNRIQQVMSSGNNVITKTLSL